MDFVKDERFSEEMLFSYNNDLKKRVKYNCGFHNTLYYNRLHMFHVYTFGFKRPNKTYTRMYHDTLLPVKISRFQQHMKKNLFS